MAIKIRFILWIAIRWRQPRDGKITQEFKFKTRFGTQFCFFFLIFISCLRWSPFMLPQGQLDTKLFWDKGNRGRQVEKRVRFRHRVFVVLYWMWVIIEKEAFSFSMACQDESESSPEEHFSPTKLFLGTHDGFIVEEKVDGLRYIHIYSSKE